MLDNTPTNRWTLILEELWTMAGDALKDDVNDATSIV